MKLDRPKSYLTSLMLYFNLSQRVEKKKVSKENFSGASYEVITLLEEEDFIPEEFSIVKCDIFNGLSARAKKLIHKIVEDLEINNALWYFDQRNNSRDQKAISELRDRKILFKTETTDVHYVNPSFIRRGSPGSVLSQTTRLLEKTSKVTKEMIKPLQAKGKISISTFDLINSTYSLS